MKKIIIYTALLLTLYSCQTVLENVPIPEIPQKAVVFGSIDASSQYHSLRITKSKPIINNSTSNEYEPIEDAIVSVTSNGTEYIFAYNPAKKTYDYNGEINLSGGLAKLEVITPTLGTLTSEVEVPDPAGAYELKLDSLVREDETEYTIQLTMPASSVAQYYRLTGYTAYATDTFDSYSTNEYHTNEEALDELIKIKSTFYQWQDANGGVSDLYIQLSRISEDYYKYGKALENYNPANPFAEPSPLPTNIEGGLGIFGISRSKIIRIN